MLTSVFALFGSALFAIPIGIISSGFALEVAKEKRRRKSTKQASLEVVAAAEVIQCWWRRLKQRWVYRELIRKEPKESIVSCDSKRGKAFRIL